jgi:chromosome partitioning protein
MAIKITFGIQKGGSSKTTTAGITAWMLAQEGYRVLAVDMDSQANLTDLLTQLDIEEFEGRTVLEAIKSGNPNEYIYRATDYLHVLPSDDYLSLLARHLYTEHPNDWNMVLRRVLSHVEDDYDYVIIDTPPSLGEPVIASLCASDYVVVLCESSKWAFTAIDRFLETVAHAQIHYNDSLKVAGVLRNLIDGRRSDSKAFAEIIGDKYSDIVFPQVVRRKAATGRISLNGFEDNAELTAAISEYKPFYEELMRRVGKVND